MRFAFLLLMGALMLRASDLQFFVHTPGQTPDGPALGASYDFGNTTIGANSTVDLRLKNTSTTQVYQVRTVFAPEAGFSVQTSFLDMCLVPGAFEDLIVSFTPQETGPASSPLEIGYMLYPASAGCPATPPQNVLTATLATLTGNGIASTFIVNLTLDGNTSTISAGNTINFNEVEIGATKAATLVVKNATSAPLALPVPGVVANVFSQSPFSLGPLTNWPSSLDPGGSASLILVFAPTQQALVTASLSLGERSYPLVGTGIAGPGLASLVVTYTLPSGVHYTISPASPVDFGSAQIASSQTFIFTILNPSTNFDSQTVSTIALSGSGFALDGNSMPALPVVLKPGDSATFRVVFSPTQAGAQSATLSIGTLTYTLTGTALKPTLNPAFSFTPQTLASAQQAQVSIQLSSPVQATTIGTLNLSFTSAVSGASDDPAIAFTSTSGRNTNVTFSPASDNGTFPDGQTAATFQTGTTAGTLTFTLSFADGQLFTKSVDITPALVQVISASAVKQSPYLVINLSAFDNTYSAGKLTFHFYDSNGNSLTSAGIGYDATTDFHNYFFLNNQAGGAFSLQAKFPVTGDITTIAAADVSVQNANGQSATEHVTF